MATEVGLRFGPGRAVIDRVTGAVGKVTSTNRLGPEVHFTVPRNGHEWDRKYTWTEAERRLTWRPDLEGS